MGVVEEFDVDGGEGGGGAEGLVGAGVAGVARVSAATDDEAQAVVTLEAMKAVAWRLED